jgi:hypothetical protein
VFSARPGAERAAGTAGSVPGSSSHVRVPTVLMRAPGWVASQAAARNAGAITAMFSSGPVAAGHGRGWGDPKPRGER